MVQRDEEGCTIILDGALRVLSSSGEDVTPQSPLKAALLVVLATSPNFTVTRAKLQDMFWGTSDAKRASGSLRSAIFQLKSEFSWLSETPIVARKSHVSLPSEYWTVVEPDSASDLISGFDLNIRGAEGFEEWLRDRRVDDGSFEKDEFDVQWEYLGKNKVPALSLGILPVEKVGVLRVEIDDIHASLDSLIQSVSQVSQVQIYDLRGVALDQGKLNHSGSPIPGYFLKTSVFQEVDVLHLRCSLLEARTLRVVRVFEPIHAQKAAKELDLMQLSEQILDAFVSIHTAAPPVDLLPWAALSSLFSLDLHSVEATENEIRRLKQHVGHHSLDCIRIFLQIFKEHEGIAKQSEVEERTLISALEKVSISDPLRPLCESLIGYSAHMLCANNEMAMFLLTSAQKRAPKLSLNLDHLATLYLATGDLPSARRAHKDCMRISSLSSWRYSYDVTGAMIALAAGDYKEALRHTNQALLQRPRFVGALRYAMIGFSMSKSEENARLMKSRILQLRQSYDLSSWTENFLRRTEPRFGNNVAITMKDYELI